MVELPALSVIADMPPAGPNLEGDAEFGAMMRAAQGRPESQYGKTIEPAVPPDWKEAAALAQALLNRTRDLRVMVTWALARLHLLGLPGFAGPVRLIRGHLETMWEPLHPQLDPEDDNDPLLRSNALLLLADPGRVLRPLRDLPLAATPRTGPVSWRDIAILNGAMEPEPGREKLTEAIVRAAFAGTDRARLAATREAVLSLQEDLLAIPAAFDAHCAAGSGPDFTDLVKLVREVLRDLARYEPLAVEADAPEPAPEPIAGDGPAEARPTRAARAPQSIQSIAALTTRDDALHALELAATYYRTHEPSSPLPLLIDRAKRLAPMPFLDVLRDLAPDGLQQAQTVVGRPDS